METKPFSMQSPEQVAKDYGGNKQKIAEAMQMGVLDPTVGTLAGMFIDRMRSAAQQEAAPQQTVAQQTFAPPAPPQAPMGAPPAPPAGLGATPQAAAMPPMGPPPEMGAPPPPPQDMGMPAPEGEMPMMAEGGMVSTYAGGGLSDVPVPDGMFDEPSNGGFDDGYAGGGLVAFAAGGAPRETAGQRQERLIRAAIPGAIVTSRQRSAAKNAQVGGNPNSYHLTDQARDFVPPPGMSLTEFGDKIKSILGPGHDVVYNSKGHFDHVHTEPGGKRSAAPIPREVDTNTFAGRGMSLEDQIAFGKSMFADLPREELDRAKAETLKDLDPAYIKKQERLGDAEAMMQAGFTLMGETGPLSASIAKAGATYMAARGASKKEQKAAKNEAIRSLMAYEELDRKTAIAALEFGMDAHKLGVTAEQQERALDFQKVELMSRIEQAGLDRTSAEKIASMRTSSPTQFESIMNIIQNGSMEDKAALEQYMKVTKPQQGMALPGMEEMSGMGDASSGMTILGSKPVQ